MFKKGQAPDIGLCHTQTVTGSTLEQLIPEGSAPVAHGHQVGPHLAYYLGPRIGPICTVCFEYSEKHVDHQQRQQQVARVKHQLKFHPRPLSLSLEPISKPTALSQEVFQESVVIATVPIVL